MNNRIWSMTLVAVMLLLASCAPRNPPLNSVLSAHGNDPTAEPGDWHMNTAEEFLFGTDMNGNLMAPNHVPNSWTRTHIHSGLTNTADFYYDASILSSGLDTDATNGIDRTMLFFYAGHGGPTSWSALGSAATQSNMSLADYVDGGLLRYYWQCSCEVFAHGPRTCPGKSFVYSCPGSFNGSADSIDHRNVYERWGPVFNPDLRMACGSSSDAYCHEDQTNRIWDDYNNKGYDVADSYINGMAWGEATPLCMTQGGISVAQTPLFDQFFTSEPNTAGTDWFHIQHTQGFDTNSPYHLVEPPKLVPIFQLIPLPYPDPIQGIELKQEGEFLVSSDVIEGRGPQIRIHPASNSIYLAGPRIFGNDGQQLDEQEYLDLALRFLEEQGWVGEKTFSEPTGVHMMLTSHPKEGGDEVQQQKDVIITFKRVVEVNGLAINVLGEGGEMQVQMNNDGSVVNASIVWRDLGDIIQEVPILTFDEAQDLAMQQVPNADQYRLFDWNWGYKEESGNVDQTELRPVFQFSFVAADQDASFDFPPVQVEISAERR